MRHFWKGFNTSKDSPPIRFKKYVIVLYWDSKEEEEGQSKDKFRKLSLKYPTVAVKVVNVRKDPLKPIKHNVHSTPTILLLKDGREVERVSPKDGSTMVEQMFRKAHT